jgi:hypothetical protein
MLARMTERPRVDRLVMFKHGVAYLERSGPAEGTFELSFRRDEMNDVLKSLAVWVAKGDARVGAVGFEAPQDPDAALAERKLLLPPREGLGALIQALRGRRVAITTSTTSDGARLEGEVIGTDEAPAADGATRRTLLLRSPSGDVVIVELARVLSISPLEQPSRESLAFLVDRGRAATSGESRTVSIAVSGRAEDLRVAYVIPSPVWRVSYRLVREGDGILLLAMGIVHNPVDEDLDGVALTLTTGQPVSFVIDLYQPKRVARLVVEETTRAPATLTRLEGGARPMAAMAMAPPSFGAPPGAPPPAPAGFAMAQSFASSAESAATGVDRGELFEYRVDAPISLKRGGSAMVPLIAARVSASRERIWRDGSPPAPDIVLSFKNTTNAVLEEGPAVIYDEGVYAGESMLSYSARGADVKLAFAKDLAVRCQRRSTSETVVNGLRITNGGVFEHARREDHVTLRAESDHDDAIDVIFELPRSDRTLLSSGAQPFEETASFQRFRAHVAPHATVEIVVSYASNESRVHRFESLSGALLSDWLSRRFLDQSAFDRLGGILRAWFEARQLDEARARMEREQQEAYAKQTKLSEQLGVLKEGGPEGALRLRYVKELEAEQDKVNRCESEVRRLRDQAESLRQRATAEIEAISRGR